MARTVAILALAALLVLALGSCGEGGGGQTTSAAATSAKIAGGGTTSAPTTAGSTVPAEMVSFATVNLTPSPDSGVAGTATLTNTSSGVEVALNVRNLQDQPGTEHPAHIHQGGACADDRAGNGAPVQYPLTAVVSAQGGTGTSMTEIPGVTVAQLFTGSDKYINVHAEQQAGNETPPGISCADLSTRQD